MAWAGATSHDASPTTCSIRVADGLPLERAIFSLLLGVVRPANEPPRWGEAADEDVTLPVPGVGQHLNRLFPVAARQFAAPLGPADFQGAAQTRQPVIGPLAFLGHAHLTVGDQVGESQRGPGDSRPLDDGLGLFGLPNPRRRDGRLFAPGDTQDE